MGEFFHGWRRKIGVVTLVLACMFTAGWVRSVLISDVVRIHNHIFGSKRAVLSWVRCIDAFTNKSYDYSTSTGEEADTWASIDARWSWNWCGVHIGDGKNTRSKAYNSIAFALIPYWMLVVPLTLTSLWLLLTKPRKSSSKKTIEPIPEQVA